MNTGNARKMKTHGRIAGRIKLPHPGIRRKEENESLWSMLQSWFRYHRTTLMLVGMALVGTGLIAYPTVADWWNSFHQSRAVASYVETVSTMDPARYDAIIRSAEQYNADLSDEGPIWVMSDEQNEAYLKELDINDTGVMGYITIDKIHIMLPVYHGTDESVLQVAIGHLAGTSLPVGGPGSHCVVSGHRGLPSAKLFTDLDKMIPGDTFTLSVLDRTYTYEVDQIRIVEPTDLSSLVIFPGQDLVTLVTCTPYGINTHRLLVRGHRIANLQGEVQVVADALQIEAVYIAPFLSVPIILLLIIIMLAGTSAAIRHRRAVISVRKGLSLDTFLSRQDRDRAEMSEVLQKYFDK